MSTTNIMGRATSQRLAIALVAIASMLGAVFVFPGTAHANATSVSIGSGSNVVLGPVTVFLADAACNDGVNNDPGEDTSVDYAGGLGDADCTNAADNGENSANGDGAFTAPTYAGFSSTSNDDWDVVFETDTQEHCIAVMDCLHVSVDGNMTGYKVDSEYFVDIDALVTLDPFVGYGTMVEPCYVAVNDVTLKAENDQQDDIYSVTIADAPAVTNVIGCGLAWRTAIEAALDFADLVASFNITVSP